MAADFSFIPGFLPMLRSTQGALETRGKFARAVAAGRFSDRARALIAIAVAQESGCDYCKWAHTNVARAAGLSWEDIAFAWAGTAIDRREAAIVQLARIIGRTGCFSSLELRAHVRDPLIGRTDLLEVIANAALAVLDNCLIQSLAPANAHASGSRRAA